MARTSNDEASSEKAQARRIMSGLEYMRKMMTGELPPSGMVQLLGLKLVEVSEGRAVFTVQPDERHYNGLGIAHCGLAATLLDSALGCAITGTSARGFRSKAYRAVAGRCGGASRVTAW
jgi:hypothetical protein